MPISGQNESQVYFAGTKSLCRVCRRPVEAKILFRGGRVFLSKFCPEHRRQECLLSSSVDWYLDCLDFPSPVNAPRAARPAREGCPMDCGFCPSHRQKPVLPVIPITSACNLDCPVCYTINRNRDAYHISTGDMERLLAAIARDYQPLNIINFTGGEPTMHPDLPRLLEMSRRAGIARLTVSTNGLRLRDEEYLAALAAADARIVLSLDTLRPETDRALLGRDTVSRKLELLDQLEKHDAATTILPAVAAGLNDDEIPALFDLMLKMPNILSLELHPLSFTGQGGTSFSRTARLTVPDLHRRLEAATGGRLSPADFVPSPLAHPHCYSIAYLLCLDGGGFVSLARLVSRRRLYGLLGETLYLEPTAKLENIFRDIVDDLFAAPDKLPEGRAVLATIRRLLEEMYPPDGRRLSAAERRRIAERSAKAVYIHSHMDEESFDVSRVMKCPICVPEADGRNIPTCSYNVLYRERDPRFAGEEIRRKMAAARLGPAGAAKGAG